MSLVVVMIKWKISFGVHPSFLQSWNPGIGQLGVLVEIPPKLLWTGNISSLFLFIVPLDRRFTRGAPIVLSIMYWHTPLSTSLSSPLVMTSTTFEGDLLLGDSSLSLSLSSILHIFKQSTPFSLTSQYHLTVGYNHRCCGHAPCGCSILSCAFKMYL